MATNARQWGIDLGANDIMACINTLARDGHIEDVAPGYSQFPLCAITGSGRVFYEQGGYRDGTTRFDRMVRWAKDNRFLAWALIGFVAASAIVGLCASVAAVYLAFAG